MAKLDTSNHLDEDKMIDRNSMSNYDWPDVMRDDIGPKDGFLNLLNQKVSFKSFY